MIEFHKIHQRFIELVLTRRALSLILTCLTSYSHAQTPEFVVEIKEHLFYPSEFSIPAGQKVKLIIFNRDATPEEFESYELNREKVIVGKNQGIVFVGPLKPGIYPFFGEYNLKTAQGRIIVE